MLTKKVIVLEILTNVMSIRDGRKTIYKIDLPPEIDWEGQMVKLYYLGTVHIPAIKVERNEIIITPEIRKKMEKRLYLSRFSSFPELVKAGLGVRVKLLDVSEFP